MALGTTDVLVSGGGIAGLAAALCFGARGFSVTVVDPAPPITEREAEGADHRSTALLAPSVKLLEDAGAWTRMAPHATPLAVMRLVDAGGAAPTPRLTRDFAAADIDREAFGQNVPNWLIRRELHAAIEAHPSVSFRTGTGTDGITARAAEALVALTDGTRLRARLVVAADGRDSPVRGALGIGVRRVRYGQKALAFAVTHDTPHRGVSTELHRTGGPFTLVPLPDHDGRASSSVVWMERAEEADRLMALDVPAFEAAMTHRSAGVLGPLRLASRRTIWPIVSQIADRFHAPRTALVAEAAHVMPPIGAQGLNTGLGDIAALVALAAPETLGDAATLARYDARRRRDVMARMAGVDLLNRAAMAEAPVLRDLRMAGLSALHRATPVRRALMRLGMG